MNKLTDTEFRVLLIIVRKTLGWIGDPLTGMRKTEDMISRKQLQLFSGRHTQAVSSAIQKLQSLGLIEIRDEAGNLLTTPEERRGKKLFYRLAQTSVIITHDGKNMFDNQSLIIKHDKSNIYTKTLSKDNGGVAKKPPSCPLLNGSKLKEQYPNGHTECVEYIKSLEARRALRYINVAKQYTALHAILKADIGFDVMDDAYPEIEAKYGRGNWDITTLAAWIEKGAGRANNRR